MHQLERVVWGGRSTFRQSSLFTVLLALLLTPSVDAQLSAQLTRCPSRCDDVGADPSNWDYLHDTDALVNCKSTVLFDLNIYNPIDDPLTHLTYRACTAAGQTSSSNDHTGEIAKRQHLSLNSTVPSNAAVRVVSWGTSTSGSTSAISSAASQIGDYLQSNSIYANTLFAKSGQVVAGVYVGSEVTIDSATKTIQKYIDNIASGGSLPAQQAIEACGARNQSIAPQFFGLMVDTSGDFATVQDALSSWSSAKCLQGDSSSALDNTMIGYKSGQTVPVSPLQRRDADFIDAPLKHRNLKLSYSQPGISPRATCSYIQAQSGDGCYSLAQRCGITQDQLQSYNGGASFCNNIKVGQYVCCSSGSPPDFSPKPYSNGTCYTYGIKSGDTCSAIANSYQTTTTAIQNNNNNTWGWMGCNNLLIGMNICLSSGTPPFPANVPNAVCGPQVNNTAYVSNVTAWSGLNPCPLNACCDIWGQCGITSDFCTSGAADTGAPGTAPPGQNGCISNCGTQIISGSPPSSYSRVGYYEVFNYGRPCLHMSPAVIPSYYTHVNFAFANISSDYTVSVSPYEDVFQQFLDQSGFKKLVSFGGWAFSTNPSTAPIFRDGVTDSQRQTFANSIAKFVQENDLDGVDFDWEYPGAPDIPGIPPGGPHDGANYLAFLKLVRAALPSNYIMSIAAPASYWYLKAFPIADISKVVDYIVYMTYDLHGQWDYGNTFTDPGCPAGNCLRSQINHTETYQAFSMITKAGVPTNKIMLGQPLYGRSFQMTQAGCYTEQCTFTGPNSGALPGTCTNTAGYISNWEINQIILNSVSPIQQYYSENAGDILIYNSTQWVSWMKPSTYNARSSWAQGLGFAGTVDWAMDLNASYTNNGTKIGDGSGVVYVPPSIYSSASPTIGCIPPCTLVFPPWSLSTSTTISQPAKTLTVQDIWPSITTLSGSVTSTVYVSKTTVTTISLPPVTTNQISVWNVQWTNSNQQIVYLTSSVVFPATTLTEASNPITTTITSPSKTSTSTTTLAGIIFTYSPGVYPPNTAPTSTQSTTPVPPPPPPGFPSSIHITVGPPPSCSGLGCGRLCSSNCAPEIPCIGICGCIGLGCPGGGGCIGPGCNAGGGSNGGDGDNTPSSSTTCATSSTVTDCEIDCSVTNYGDTSYQTACYRTSCSQIVTCATTGTTTTSATTTAACPISFSKTSTWSPAAPSSPLPTLGSNNQYTGAGVTNPSGSYKSTTTVTSTSFYSTTTVTVTPTPSRSTSTTTVTVSAQPSQSYFINVYNREILVANRGSAQDTWSWVMDSLNSNNPNDNICDFNSYPPLTSSIYQHTSPYPTYPSTLGPFSMTGHATCSYQGPNTATVGSIGCADGYKAACTPYPAAQQTKYVDCGPADSSRNWWYYDFYCYYG